MQGCILNVITVVDQRVSPHKSNIRGIAPDRPIWLTRLFSEGGEVIKLRIEGSLTIPTAGIKGYNYGNAKHTVAQALGADRAVWFGRTQEGG